MTGYPRPVTSVHQIEVTTRCNLRCVYCPSPKLHEPQFRGVPKGDMTMDTFARALEHCRHYASQDTQGELSLTGIGETLLHPQWREMVAMAAEALPGHFLNFSTNGLLLDDDACQWLARHDFMVYISLHRPEKAGHAVEAAKRAGILAAVNGSAAISAFDWAGQIDYFVSAPAATCEWLRAGWANVLVDGRITTCCLDAAAKGVVGHVDDEPGTHALRPFSLCSDCHMTVPAAEELA